MKKILMFTKSLKRDIYQHEALTSLAVSPVLVPHDAVKTKCEASDSGQNGYRNSEIGLLE